MTYKRFKEIKKILRSYDFTSYKLKEYGISREEWDFFDVRNPVRQEYENRMNRRPIKLFILGFILFITCPIWIGVPISLVQNYYQTKAIESLTGKNLNFWDIYWAGGIIRANTELKEAKN